MLGNQTFSKGGKKACKEVGGTVKEKCLMVIFPCGTVVWFWQLFLATTFPFLWAKVEVIGRQRHDPQIRKHEWWVGRGLSISSLSQIYLSEHWSYTEYACTLGCAGFSSGGGVVDQSAGAEVYPRKSYNFLESSKLPELMVEEPLDFDGEKEAPVTVWYTSVSRTWVMAGPTVWHR